MYIHESYFTLVKNLFHLMIFWNTLHTGELGYQFSSFAPCCMLNKVLNNSFSVWRFSRSCNEMFHQSKICLHKQSRNH